MKKIPRILLVLLYCIAVMILTATKLSRSSTTPIVVTDAPDVIIERKKILIPKKKNSEEKNAVTGSSGLSSLVHAQRSSIPTLQQHNTTLPKWMVEYLEWHVKQRAQLTPENWNETKYAVVSCLAINIRCGGASDRLHSLPWDVMMAARAGRLLLYRWERPCALEEFLIPNDIDWTAPEWLWKELVKEREPMILGSSEKDAIDMYMKYPRRLVRFWMKSSSHGASFYNEENPSESPFAAIFGTLWAAFFKPSPAIQSLIDQNMKELGLTPRDYIAGHLRQKYVVDKSRNHLVVENHVRCAYRERPNTTIYFAADNQNTVKHAVLYGQLKSTPGRRVHVVGRTNASDPLHLDRGADFFRPNQSWRNSQPSDFYEIFVDFYLLAQAKCVIFGKGGFGQWASLLTTEPCSYRQVRGPSCRWKRQGAII